MNPPQPHTATLCLALLMVSMTALDFPAAFTVVRNIAPPLSIDGFLEKTSCCKTDSQENPNGYTIVSLDGFKALSTSAVIQAGISPLSIWVNAFSQIASSKAGRGGSSTVSLQTYLLQQYHSSGVQLLLNALGDEAPISDLNASAVVVAQTIVEVVKSAQLDGVSVEFTDYQAVAAGTASSWLQQFLSALKLGLQDKTIVLIVPVSIVSQVLLLQQPLVNAYVDMFVLKYYGFNKPDYLNYNSIFNASTHIPQTAFAQLLQSATVGIDLCRTLIAKPLSSSQNGYVNAVSLGVVFETAQAQLGWFGGLATLDLEADTNSGFQQQAMQQLRNSCLRTGDCYCQ